MELYSFSSDTEQDKTELESVWRISFVTLDEEKLNGNQYGELLFTVVTWTR